MYFITFVMLLLLFTHIFFTFRLGFPQKWCGRGVKLSLSGDKQGKSGLSSFAALSTNLAATLGTGNIIGISTAVYLGGPGAVFWCWITGLLGMATCFLECYLAALHKQKDKEHQTFHGGAMYILLTLPIPFRRLLASIYALGLMLASFGIGSSTQANALGAAFSKNFRLPPFFLALLLLLASALVITGGITFIGRFCSLFVPVMAGSFLLFSIWFLLRHFGRLPDVLTLILKDAFSFESLATGGLTSSGFLAMRYGIIRGLYTNEAGMGTAGIAASTSGEPPFRQALVSMTSVFWDTVVMCLFTGLVIVTFLVVSQTSPLSYGQGDLVFAAFATLPFGEQFLSFSIAGFAFTTIISWYYYGEEGCRFLFPTKFIWLFQVVYLLSVFWGVLLPMDLLWNLSDYSNCLLVLPNLLCLYLLKSQREKIEK